MLCPGLDHRLLLKAPFVTASSLPPPPPNPLLPVEYFSALAVRTLSVDAVHPICWFGRWIDRTK